MNRPIFSHELYVSAPVEDGLLIARPTDDRLFLFNGTARFIWERLAEGIGESEMPELIAARYGIDEAIARDDFQRTLRIWRADGLMRTWDSQRRYEIAGLAFDIRCDDQSIADVLAPLLAHLASDAAGPAALAIDLERHDGTIVLRANGTETGRAGATDALLEILFTGLFRRVTERAEWDVSIHAAAVGRNGACVLMPGASGSGKSSLTAALMSVPGLQFVADDLALLAGIMFEIAPLPLPIVIKSGSWDALRGLLPDLSTRPVYRRFGQECRYWTPPHDQIARQPMRVKAIVFPCYSRTSRATLAPLTPLEVLSRITVAPSAVRPPITGRTVEALAAFARSVPAYALDYDELASARHLIADLLL